MAHPEQMDFVKYVKSKYPHHFRHVKILEVGSRDINGRVRPLFEMEEDYVGIDCINGNGVTWVGLAHTYNEKKDFDIAISCEAFEHDPYWKQTVAHMIELLRPGGLFVATFASDLRPEHGTERTDDGSGAWGPDANYYHGISVGEFKLFMDTINNQLGTWNVESGRGGQDTYAYAFKGEWCL